MSVPPEPYTNLCSPSATVRIGGGKIKRPRRATAKSRRQAAALAGAKTHGPYTPVTVTLTLRRGGTEPYVEVRNHEGRFFVEGTSSIVGLLSQVIRGGHWIEAMGEDVRVSVLEQRR